MHSSESSTGNVATVNLALTILATDRRVELPSETRVLTTAVASGDTEAFALFFNRWFEWMGRESARLSGRDDAFCADVVQDSMMRVIRSLKPLDTEDSLRRWLRVVVRSCVYDRLRAEARRRARDRAAARPARRQPDPDLQGRIRWLERELQSIGDANADLLLMRYRFGWTLQQIGAVLGLKAGAVDGRLRRLLSTLRGRERERHDG